MYRSAAMAAVLWLTMSQSAWADGVRAEPSTWRRAWNFDPLILLCLGAAAWLYARGLARLRAKVGAHTKVRRWQAACCFAALAVIFVALISPVDALSEELSSVHMIQHMLLAMVAALLFVLSSPTFVLAWGLPELHQGRRRSWFTLAFRLPQVRTLRQPLVAWALFAVTLWSWHHPILYQAALQDPLLHDAQHLSFFIAGFLFWRVCLDPLGGRRLPAPVAVPYLFTTSLHAAALGIFLALSPRVWYGHYASRTSAWGLTALEDQQLAGLIMWVPACLIYPTVAAALFGTWLTNLGAETRKVRRERLPSLVEVNAWNHR